jgi:hypothetical protein
MVVDLIQGERRPHAVLPLAERAAPSSDRGPMRPQRPVAPLAAGGVAGPPGRGPPLLQRRPRAAAPPRAPLPRVRPQRRRRLLEAIGPPSWGAGRAQPRGPLLAPALRPGAGAVTDLKRPQAVARGSERRPPPRRGARPALERPLLAPRAVLERPEHGREGSEVHLREMPVGLAGRRPGLPLLRRLQQPVPHRVRLDRAAPRGAAQAPARRAAAAHGDAAGKRDALAVAPGAMGLQKGASAAGAGPLPPGPTTGMAIGPEVAHAAPAALATVGSQPDLLGGGALPLASSRRDPQRWRGAGRLPARRATLCTGVAGGLAGRADTGLGGAGALAGWRAGLGWGRSHCSGLQRPPPVEPQEHPHQDAQPALGQNELGDHGPAPSQRGYKGHGTGFCGRLE